MNILCFEDNKLAAEHVAEVVEKQLKDKPDSVFCIAAGHTSLPVFDAIIAKDMDFSAACFVDMDEWVGVSHETKGSCGYFLESNFFIHTNFSKENICLFNGTANNLLEEAARVENVIENWGGIDYLLLGMGINGHLALNEPGEDFALGARVVPLSQTTVEVAPKYFPQGMPKIESGITLGIKNLIAAKKIQLAVFGEHKKTAVKRLLDDKLNATEDFPASILYKNDNVDLLIDKAAMPE